MSINKIIICAAFAFVSMTSFAAEKAIDPFREFVSQAEKEGSVTIIVVLSSGKNVPDLLSALQSTESKDVSYTQQQDEFMAKLGSSGVLDHSYFNETPSIALKLELPAIKRLAKIKEVSQVIPAPDNSLIFEQ